MRDPLESRFRLRCKFALVFERLYAAAEEALFVLILIILVFLYYYLFAQLPRCYRAALDSVFDLTSLVFEVVFTTKCMEITKEILFSKQYDRLMKNT